MWWSLAYLLYMLLHGLGWLIGIAAVCSLALVFLLLVKGRSVGVTRDELVFLAGAGIAALVLCFLSVISFDRATATRHWLSEKVFEVAQKGASECDKLGDTQSLQKPTKVMIFSADGELAKNSVALSAI